MRSRSALFTNTVISRYKIAGHKIVSEAICVSRSSGEVNMNNCQGLAKSPSIL